jgi:aryl-alcohol dehydrogenase-like predicted oxidoreductase
MQSNTVRKLGYSPLMVSPVGLGVMQFAGGGGMFRFMFSMISQGEKDQIVKTALEGGINWFDTAEYYGRGRSERTLRKAIKNNQVADEDVLIATKWWPLLRTAKSIGRTIDKRLENLKGYSIDLHQVHWPIGFSPPEDEMDAMADLVEQGKIRAVGVSNFNPEYTRRAHLALERRGLGLASNQVHFNLLDRSIETNGVLDAAKDLGISIIAYSPLATGLLTGKFHLDPEALSKTPFVRRMQLKGKLDETRDLIMALDEIAKKHRVSISQVALNWTVNFHGDTVVAIPGASKVSHAREAGGVLDFRLTEEEMTRLDELTRRYR